MGVSKAFKKLAPIGSNMNDGAYPFRGEFSLPPGLNHGHASSPEKLAEAEESGERPVTEKKASVPTIPPSMPAATTTVITSHHFPDKGITIYSNAATTAAAGKECGKRRSTTGLSHRPTSLSLRITGRELKIEQLESITGQSMRCELGINGGMLRPLQLENGKLLATTNTDRSPLAVPSDGKDYNLVAVLLNAKGKAEHYCHVTLNAGGIEKSAPESFFSPSSSRAVYTCSSSSSPPPFTASSPPMEWVENDAYGPWGGIEEGSGGGGPRDEGNKGYGVGGSPRPPWTATGNAMPSPLPWFVASSSSSSSSSSSPAPTSSFPLRYLRLRAPPPSQQPLLSLFLDGRELLPRDGWYYLPVEGRGGEGAILLTARGVMESQGGMVPSLSSAVGWSRGGEPWTMDPRRRGTARREGKNQATGRRSTSRSREWEVQAPSVLSQRTHRPCSSPATTLSSRTRTKHPSTERHTREGEDMTTTPPPCSGPWPTTDTTVQEERRKGNRGKRGEDCPPFLPTWEHTESTPWPFATSMASASSPAPSGQFLSSSIFPLPWTEGEKGTAAAAPAPTTHHPTWPHPSSSFPGRPSVDEIPPGAPLNPVEWKTVGGPPLSSTAPPASFALHSLGMDPMASRVDASVVREREVWHHHHPSSAPSALPLSGYPDTLPARTTAADGREAIPEGLQRLTTVISSSASPPPSSFSSSSATATSHASPAIPQDQRTARVPRVETFVRWTQASGTASSSSTSSTPFLVARAWGYYLVLQEEGQEGRTEGVHEAMLPLRPVTRENVVEAKRELHTADGYRWIHMALWDVASSCKVLEQWTQVVVDFFFPSSSSSSPLPPPSGSAGEVSHVPPPSSALRGPVAGLSLLQEGQGGGGALYPHRSSSSSLPLPSSVRATGAPTGTSMAAPEFSSSTALQPPTTLPSGVVGSSAVGIDNVPHGPSFVAPGPHPPPPPPPPSSSSSAAASSSPLEGYTLWLRDIANVLSERTLPPASSSSTAPLPFSPSNLGRPSSENVVSLASPFPPPPPPPPAGMPPEVAALQQYIWQALVHSPPLPTAPSSPAVGSFGFPPPPPLLPAGEPHAVSAPSFTPQEDPHSPSPSLPLPTTSPRSSLSPPLPQFSFFFPSLPRGVEAVDAGRDVRLTATVDNQPVPMEVNGPHGLTLPPDCREVLLQAFARWNGQPVGSCRLHAGAAATVEASSSSSLPVPALSTAVPHDDLLSSLLVLLEQYPTDPLLVAHRLASLDARTLSMVGQRVLPLLCRSLQQCSSSSTSTAASLAYPPPPPLVGTTTEPYDAPSDGEKRRPPPLASVANETENSRLPLLSPSPVVSSSTPLLLPPPPPPPPLPSATAGSPLIHFTTGMGRIENIFTLDPSVQLSVSRNHGMAEAIPQHSHLPVDAGPVSPATIPTVWTIQAREVGTDGVGTVCSEVEVTVVGPSTAFPLSPPPPPPSASSVSSTLPPPHTFFPPPPLMHATSSSTSSPLARVSLPLPSARLSSPVTAVGMSLGASSASPPRLSPPPPPPPPLPSMAAADAPLPPYGMDGSRPRRTEEGGVWVKGGEGGEEGGLLSSGIPLPQFFLVPPPAVLSESTATTPPLPPPHGALAPLNCECLGRGDREGRIRIPEGFSSSLSASTPPLLLDMSLQCVQSEVQIDVEAPAGMLVVCFVDGVGGNTGKPKFSAKVPSHVPHRLTLRLVDQQYGQMCFEQRMDLPAIASTRWGLSLHDGGLTLDPEVCGSVSTSISLDHSPERAVQQNAVVFDIYKPHYISLHRYFNGCHGVCMGELTFRLPSFVNPKDLKSLLHILRMWVKNKIDGLDFEREMLLLGTECTAPVLREILEVLVEIGKRLFHATRSDEQYYPPKEPCGNEEGGRDALSTPRVYFRLVGGEQPL